MEWVRGISTPAYTIVENHNSTTAQPVLTFTTTGYPLGTSLKSTAPEAPDQVMSWTQSGAIFASTKHPESSKLFMSWLLSDEFQQSISATGPTTLRHLDAISGFDNNKSNVTQVSGFPEFINDTQNVEWWKLQFETKFGFSAGRNPT